MGRREAVLNLAYLTETQRLLKSSGHDQHVDSMIKASFGTLPKFAGRRVVGGFDERYKLSTLKEISYAATGMKKPYYSRTVA